MYDANAVLQASVTKTASFTGATYDLLAGTPLGGLVARQTVTAASGTTPTLSGKIQESDDGSTWNDLVNFDQVTAAGVSFERFFTRKRYIRHVATIGGTSPSFTYVVELGIGLP